jgi:1-acyl-sn-glycerol-3-phosphate acyltransferase
MTFYDNKELLSYTFFSGRPGLMRVKVHRFFETKNQNQEYKKTLKEAVRNVILNELQNDIR